MTDGRRRFNSTERMALYLIAGGVCSLCGKPLAQWHADHVIPYSVNPETDVMNGQALCPQCNLKKGATMFAKKMSSPSLPIWTFPLRDWQIQAYEKYVNADTRDFLAVATPGAGKTVLACRIGHYLITTNQIDVVVIVCPTDHLRSQWAEGANGKKINGVFYPFGLNISRDWTSTSGDIPADCHGVAITYHQVASPLGRDVIRWLFGNRRVFAIFDEVHHAGEDMTWGDSIWNAFERAERRFCISGTPFRADNNRIPFVQYDADKRSVADYSYSYADALRDQVCRPVIFPSYEGEMEWFSRTGVYIKAVFQEMLNEQQAGERLNTALNPNGKWLPEVLKAANETLMGLRSNGDPRAGGLIITKDTDHADAVAKKLFEITGIKPVVATSKDPDASTLIKNFGNGDGAWIVAVKMISEGVDISRLRVLVYATNITTELFFRQAVGRIVRVRAELDEQTAYFYMPSDRRFLDYAQSIKDERDHVLVDAEDEETERTDNAAIGDTLLQAGLYMPIEAIAERGNTVFDSDVITPFELEEAKRLKASMGASMMGIPDELFAKMIKRIRKEQAQAAPTPQPTEPESEDYSLRLRRLKTSVNTLINRYCAMSGVEQKDVHWRWQQRYGGQKHAQATEEELKAKKAWVLSLIEEWNNGRK